MKMKAFESCLKRIEMPSAPNTEAYNSLEGESVNSLDDACARLIRTHGI